MLTLMDSFDATKDLNVAYKTATASMAAAAFRIFLMPVVSHVFCHRFSAFHVCFLIIPIIQFYFVHGMIPQDTVKTTMQVTGKFSNVVNKVKVEGVSALYHGSLAAASGEFKMFL